MSGAEETNPYELLGLTIEATEAEIRTAYRQRSLKVHPDRNRGNPDAARKFHELNQAYELLLDPLRRMALDAKVRIKEARKVRFASYDAKRKGLVEELEARERAFKKARLDKNEEERARQRENERLMEEGRKLREERERKLREREVEMEAAQQARTSEYEPPALGDLDTTVRLKYPLSSHPSLTTPASLVELLSRFGKVDEDSIKLLLKPSPPKKPKRVIALVPFRQIGGAFAAVCASGRAESGLAGIEVNWGEDKEPELIGWLKKMGKLGVPHEQPARDKKATNVSAPAAAGAAQPPESSTGVRESTTSSSPFSSFPSTFPDLNAQPVTPSISSAESAAGLDYESLTLMRLRQAERARLERDIREREAAGGE
ncbi:DnaJ-domain-containing protein [Laetiporus sulphureus 93-53]|uniref:DnaJ-domain-containing protein n=1 Tax=Laetiporus sulphureus 93-53 TaxID=1314785 RepID=A0A165BJW9_9APHY|nr:DnaJ-domain-containing protein [Laetiporus sulphureus 93-53]KZT01197.1 DnaJ-domain-containing protein [Laetiporus sulphureus 93-53]